MKRNCLICGMPLSQYNKSTVCFCHPIHPYYNERTLNDKNILPIGAGKNTSEINRVIIDYYGKYPGPWHQF